MLLGYSAVFDLGSVTSVVPYHHAKELRLYLLILEQLCRCLGVGVKQEWSITLVRSEAPVAPLCFLAAYW